VSCSGVGGTEVTTCRSWSDADNACSMFPGMGVFVLYADVEGVEDNKRR
jgi:hypothetical protein